MKAKIFTQLVFGILLSALQSHAQNILADGDFSKTEEIKLVNSGSPPMNVWYTHIEPNVKATAKVIDGICGYEIFNSGAHYYDVQLMQSGFPLVLGHLYRLSFRVKSDAERLFGVFLGQDGDPWTNLITANKYVQNSAIEWQTISIDVKVLKVFDLHRLCFDLGNQAVKTYFDDITLLDLGSIPAKVKRNPQSADLILGEWFPANNSRGGLGSKFKFLPEGKAEISFGVLVRFKYRIEGDTLVWVLTPEDSSKFKFEIDGDKLILSGGGRGNQVLIHTSGDPNLGIIGRWTGDHYTGKKQILDFTPSLNQFVSVPFDTDFATYQIEDDSIKIAGKQAISLMWYVEADTLNLVRGEDSQTSKYTRIK